ncbi:hypothetical protein HDU85_002342 [Gaertneriomyces sp. JEL0708]|nr:hypothetical protein HDU85_002342 [Gaertneriomyces sp. JEL0708]
MSQKESGYIDTLTDVQKTTLADFRKRVGEEIAKLGFEDEHLELWGSSVKEIQKDGDIGADIFDNAKVEDENVKPVRSRTVILLKFLRAREWNVDAAVTMLIDTLKWRKDINMPSLLTESFPDNINSLGAISGVSLNNTPITYNYYTELGSLPNDSYPTFLRWRIQLMERAIATLAFHRGIETVTQIHDYTDVGMFSMTRNKELKPTIKEITRIFQNHYPEFLERKYFIGVPKLMTFLFNTFSMLVSKRTRDRFCLVTSEKTRGALLEHIDIRQLEERYGGVPHSLKPDEMTEIAVPARKMRVLSVALPNTMSTTVKYFVTTCELDVEVSVGFMDTDALPAQSNSRSISGTMTIFDVADAEALATHMSAPQRVEVHRGTVTDERKGKEREGESRARVFVLMLGNGFSYLTEKKVKIGVVVSTEPEARAD